MKPKLTIVITGVDWQPMNLDQVRERVFGRRMNLLRAEQDLTEGPCDPAWFCLRETRLAAVDPRKGADR